MRNNNSADFVDDATERACLAKLTDILTGERPSGGRRVNDGPAEVVDHLFVGSGLDAVDRRLLNRLRITHVLNCTSAETIRDYSDVGYRQVSTAADKHVKLPLPVLGETHSSPRRDGVYRLHPVAVSYSKPDSIRRTKTEADSDAYLSYPNRWSQSRHTTVPQGVFLPRGTTDSTAQYLSARRLRPHSSSPVVGSNRYVRSNGHWISDSDLFQCSFSLDVDNKNSLRSRYGFDVPEDGFLRLPTSSFVLPSSSSTVQLKNRRHGNGVFYDVVAPPPRITVPERINVRTSETYAQNASDDGPHDATVRRGADGSPYDPSRSTVRAYLEINADDTPGYPLLRRHYPTARQFIETARATGGRALIHCELGINRSVALAIAYLMDTEGVSLMKAVRQLRIARPNVLRNEGFRRQLVQFAAERRLLEDQMIDVGHRNVSKPCYQ